MRSAFLMGKIIQKVEVLYYLFLYVLFFIFIAYLMLSLSISRFIHRIFRAFYLFSFIILLLYLKILFIILLRTLRSPSCLNLLIFAVKPNLNGKNRIAQSFFINYMLRTNLRWNLLKELFQLFLVKEVSNKSISFY